MDMENLPEYERRRLENIKRNSEMMASLKIHSHVSDLSVASKRLRVEKSYKQSPEKKKPKPEAPIVIRRSLRTRGMPPDSSGLPQDFNESLVKPSRSSPMKSSSPPKKGLMPSKPLSMKETYEGEGSHLLLVEKLSRLTRETKAERGERKEEKRKTRSSNSCTKLDPWVKLEEPFDPSVKLEEPLDPRSLHLYDDNVARVVPGRIFSVRFFPTTNMTMVVAGNKYGHLGFWDVNPQHREDKDVIHLYQPHSAPISGISMHPFSLSKVYSSCYDGFLRMINIEIEKFELAYTSTCGDSLYSLAQHPNDVNSLYVGEGPGVLNIFDQRMGKISMSWPLHVARINSIHFNPANTNIMATSSTDGYACLWDVRNINIKGEHPEQRALHTVKHSRAVHSAYFSPCGSCLATTSLDDNIGVICGANFEDEFMIPHDTWTNRWVSSFRAIWGWDDTHLFIGNMKRKVDVLSVTQKRKVYSLESPNMTAIPCRYDAHPCNVGMLAGATSGGQVYIWTASI